MLSLHHHHYPPHTTTTTTTTTTIKLLPFFSPPFYCCPPPHRFPCPTESDCGAANRAQLEGVEENNYLKMFYLLYLSCIF